MAKSIFQYGLLAILKYKDGYPVEKYGRVYQLSIFSVTDLPKVRIITMDLVENVDRLGAGCIVVENDYIVQCKMPQVEEVLIGISLTKKGAPIPKGTNPLVDSCVSLMRVALSGGSS